MKLIKKLEQGFINPINNTRPRKSSLKNQSVSQPSQGGEDGIRSTQGRMGATI